MGKVLPNYKKVLIDEIIDAVTANTSQYYAFASNPIAYVGSPPTTTDDDYSANFTNDWQMIFGKKLKPGDFAYMIENNVWTSGTVYDRYIDTSNTLYSNNNFYVVCEPSPTDGKHYIYKCIDNNNGANSTTNPATGGSSAITFQTADSYKWRYITSISAATYTKFATNDYVPVFPDATIVSTAKTYSGIDVVVVANGGSGYQTYSQSGLKIQSKSNTTLLQIDSSEPQTLGYYNNNSIYIYNTGSPSTSQLKNISSYTSNSSGRWVTLDSAANTDNITVNVTQYLISPRVVFNTDGTSPIAYSVVNTSTNTISSITILDSGSNISRANVSIATLSYGSGANLYAIVPPPGGHGSSPVSELNIKGLGIGFYFSKDESNTIPSNTVYNKIGLIKNPYVLNANNTKGSRYSSNTFKQVLEANLSSGYVFSVGESLSGVTSGAKGTVVFSNSTILRITGDKNFSNGEYIANSSGSSIGTININSLGNIYAKDVIPLYYENINNVTRSNTQTESFKIIIQV
jgi:hypothetical protein